MASPFSPTGLVLDPPTAFSAKQLKSDIHAYNACLNHRFSWFFNFIASHVMDWVRWGKADLLADFIFHLTLSPRLTKLFPRGCGLSKRKRSSNRKQWNILTPVQHLRVAQHVIGKREAHTTFRIREQCWVFLRLSSKQTSFHWASLLVSAWNEVGGGSLVADGKPWCGIEEPTCRK